MTSRPTHLRQTAAGWLIQAPAKINLYLEVLGRRPDGFHDLQTLIAPIGLYDTLLVAPSADSKISLRVHASGQPGLDAFPDASPLPTDNRNLIVLALERLRAALGVEAGADVTLWKRIPSRAGLGGGSSDAAAALVAGQRLWNAQLPPAELQEVAAGLGSDVPAMLAAVEGRGASVCRGRGEQVSPAQVPGGFPCLLVQPPFGLGAGEVYAELTDSERRMSDQDRLGRLSGALTRGDLAGVSRDMFNSLQQPAARVANRRGHTVVDRITQTLRRLTVDAWQMTGSGSVFFGLCRSWRHARRAAAELRAQRIGWVGLAGTC